MAGLWDDEHGQARKHAAQLAIHAGELLRQTDPEAGLGTLSRTARTELIFLLLRVTELAANMEGNAGTDATAQAIRTAAAVREWIRSLPNAGPPIDDYPNRG